MARRLISSVCTMAALLASVTAVPRASAMPVLQAAEPPQSTVEQVTYRHRIHHRRSLRQPEPEYDNRVPTGGGDYGGPDTAFPVGENSAVRPGGSYAITAPIGTPAYAIQKEQQRRFCRDNPEVC